MDMASNFSKPRGYKNLNSSEYVNLQPTTQFFCKVHPHNITFIDKDNIQICIECKNSVLNRLNNSKTHNIISCNTL